MSMTFYGVPYKNLYRIFNRMLKWINDRFNQTKFGWNFIEFSLVASPQGSLVSMTFYGVPYKNLYRIFNRMLKWINDRFNQTKFGWNFIEFLWWHLRMDHFSVFSPIKKLILFLNPMSRRNETSRKIGQVCSSFSFIAVDDIYQWVRL